MDCAKLYNILVFRMICNKNGVVLKQKMHYNKNDLERWGKPGMNEKEVIKNIIKYIKE